MNLQYMRRFYLTHQKQQTLSVKLTWSHYCELLGVDDDLKRSFYEREAANSGWSVRELRRPMNSMLFERTLNARDDARSADILALANEGVVYQEPKDAVRNPYVLRLLARGQSLTVVEDQLCISNSTARTHTAVLIVKSTSMQSRSSSPDWKASLYSQPSNHLHSECRF